MKKIYILCLGFLLCSCSENKVIGIEGKWETKYVIRYDFRHSKKFTIYTENEVYTCSFNGTNYLIEKDNPEELVSTTAPIEIIKTFKIENDKTK